MRTTLILAIFTASMFTSVAFSQEIETEQEQISFGNESKKSEMRTLFQRGNEPVSHGAYGSVTTGFTTINGKSSFLTGGRAAYIANHRMAIGFAGYGFYNNITSLNLKPTPTDYSLIGGYGGMFIEPIVMPNNPIHISFPIFFGVGGVVVADDYGSADYRNLDYDYSNDYNAHNTNAAPFLVFEPGAELEINVVKFFRIAVGASYRLTNDIKLDYFGSDDLSSADDFSVNKTALNGMNYTVSLKFGWF